MSQKQASRPTLSGFFAHESGQNSLEPARGAEKMLVEQALNVVKSLRELRAFYLGELVTGRCGRKALDICPLQAHPQSMRSRTWSDAQFVAAVACTSSIAGVLRELGLDPAGANYRTVHISVHRLGLDTSHWTGRGHRKGLSVLNVIKPLAEILVEHSSVARANLKRRLLREGLLKNECDLCGQPPVWKGQPLVLVLDHENGVNDDCRIQNLRLLCPNCNSQQATFAGRNMLGKRVRVVYTCASCGRPIQKVGLTGCCISCAGAVRAKATSKEVNLQTAAISDVLILGLRGTARKYRVSPTTVKRWIRQRGVKAAATGSNPVTP